MGYLKRKLKRKNFKKKYDTLIEESYKLSTINRTKSDEKQFEANEVLKQIDNLNK